ncbi:hypothetical protein KIN20_001721 [Parelaphostrongylus tenuis]|uniref:Chondroitin proteoglycan 3 n=1 Tax=Parelaphostrongylus tenuis TaxID=148309 RepID=A0AAD5LYS2_PARTN|nr:hypothetical protein KIN20_001721 [Parelaphostrongylus tenuis]
MKALLFLFLTIYSAYSLLRSHGNHAKMAPGTQEDNSFNAAVATRAKRGQIEGSGMEGAINESSHEEVSNAHVKDVKKCKPLDRCYSDGDCPGGHCLGAFVGTCNCNACIDLWLCEGDSACGGLEGACNNITRTCDCNAGFRAAGFSSFFSVLGDLCNRKTCNNDDHIQRCFGLPCNFGHCIC